MAGSTVEPVKMRRCKRCKVHTVDTEERCPSCGAPTVRWYVETFGKVLVVVLAIVVLIFIILNSGEPAAGSLPPSE